jgi:hypothetical protein
MKSMRSQRKSQGLGSDDFPLDPYHDGAEDLCKRTLERWDAQHPFPPNPPPPSFPFRIKLFLLFRLRSSVVSQQRWGRRAADRDAVRSLIFVDFFSAVDSSCPASVVGSVFGGGGKHGTYGICLPWTAGVTEWEVP